MHNVKIVAAGGIVEGRGAAAALALGADGIVLGTRLLACEEANVSRGYQDDVIRSTDGGVSTVRSKVYDSLRGTTEWPNRYGGRGIINESYLDAKDGVVTDDNKRKYQEAFNKGNQGWGKHGRLTAYAGTGVGLIKQVMSAKDILQEIRNEVRAIQERTWLPRSKL